MNWRIEIIKTRVGHFSWCALGIQLCFNPIMCIFAYIRNRICAYTHVSEWITCKWSSYKNPAYRRNSWAKVQCANGTSISCSRLWAFSLLQVIPLLHISPLNYFAGRSLQALQPWQVSPSLGTKSTTTSTATCHRHQWHLARPRRCWGRSTMWCSSTTMAR